MSCQASETNYGVVSWPYLFHHFPHKLRKLIKHGYGGLKAKHKSLSMLAVLAPLLWLDTQHLNPC